jgi:hypothetical protein
MWVKPSALATLTTYPCNHSKAKLVAGKPVAVLGFEKWGRSQPHSWDMPSGNISTLKKTYRIATSQG